VNESCYGQASNCITVTPSTCAATAAAPPTGVAVTTPADNQVRVSWNTSPGAAAYKVSRKTGTCASTEPYASIGVVAAPGTTFLDTTVEGSVTYAYAVASSDASCAACTSALSTCKQITAKGKCTHTPTFAGIGTLVASTSGPCVLTASWSAGSAFCGGPLKYSVYRSTDGFFTPSLANRVASGITGTSYTDASASSGVRYYYIVRAVDSFGNTDSNTKRISGTPVGTLTAGTFADDAGDTGTAKFIPSPTANNGWTTGPNDTANGNATRIYATTASGDYPVSICEGLESPTIYLGANPTLSFRSRYDMEQGWDGGYIEVSTEAGGFSDWTKLDTVNYPGVMSGPLGDPACGTPGFADGQMVFTGSGGWSSFSGSLSAYANQHVRIRFLFSSDTGTVATGWFIDDVSVSNAFIPSGCLGEVSGKDAGRPLLVRKHPSNLDLIFEDLGTAANSYNVYEGHLGTWYSHTGTRCHDTTSTPGSPSAGYRTLSGYTTSSTRAYFLISASNPSTEGVLGEDSQSRLIAPPNPPCGPTP